MKLIINIDGGSRGNPGPGASGVLIKDAGGAVLLAKGYFLGDCTNNFAEFSALKIALEEAKTLGGAELEIRSDSQLLVKQYLGEYKIKHDVLKELMARIKVLSCAFRKIKITHVYRENNAEADRLANEAMDKALGIKKSDTPPIIKPKEPRVRAVLPAQTSPQKTTAKKASAQKGEQLELF